MLMKLSPGQQKKSFAEKLNFKIFCNKACKMVFEVQGKTDQFVQLKKDERGIQFLGKTLMTSLSSKSCGI